MALSDSRPFSCSIEVAKKSETEVEGAISVLKSSNGAVCVAVLSTNAVIEIGKGMLLISGNMSLFSVKILG